MTPDTQTICQNTIVFAALRHQGQKIPGSEVPYIVHVSNVAMEILLASPSSPNMDVNFAVQLAFLHDTLEDTSTTYEELSGAFGGAVADGVSALTKDSRLSKDEKMADSLGRIRHQPHEVWAVKLADRITNLQEPPAHWDTAKRRAYREEAIVILEALKGGNAYLEERMGKKIEEYEQYYK